MATQLQIRRGTAAQVAAFTGAEGEIVYNSTNDSLHTNDGATAGGFELARADLNNVSNADLNAALTGNTLSALTITTLTSGAGTFSGTVTADGLVVETSGNNYARINSTEGWSRLYLDRGVDTGRAQIIMQTSGAEDGGSWAMGLWDDETFRLQNWAGADNNTFTVSAGGDISFYEDTGSSPKFFWDSSAESLGIGTSSPSFLGFGSSTGGIDIVNSTNAALRLSGNAADAMFFVSGSGQHWLYGKGAVPMTFSTNGTERLRIDSNGVLQSNGYSVVASSARPASGTLRLGNIPSTSMLFDYDDQGQTIATVRNQYGSLSPAAELSLDSGFITFNTGTSFTERLRIDASGNVQQGNYSDTTIKNFNMRSAKAIFNIAVDGATDGAGTTINYSWAGGGQGPLKFSDASSEKMRLDASGNLLAAGTNTNPVGSNVVGHALSSDGRVQHSTTGNTVMKTNQTTDGDIAQFRVAGASVGSIGTISGLVTIGGSGTTGLVFDSGQIYPWNMTTNTAIDASKDLGVAGARFKDLYLSGDALTSTVKFLANTTVSGSDATIFRPADNTMAFSTNGAERMRLDSSGSLLLASSTNWNSVGTIGSLVTGAHYTRLPTANGLYWLSSVNTSNQYIVQNNVGNGVYIAYGATSWSSTSDERLKDIIEPITGGLEKVATLRTVIGKYKTDEEEVRRPFLMAQDVFEVLPEAVDQSNPDAWGLSTHDLTPLLVSALKDAKNLIEALTARIEALEGA